MSKIRLLEHALTGSPEYVIDIGTGSGWAAKAFIGNGARVVGVDVKDSPHEHKNYTHVQLAFEVLEPQDDAEKFDLVWCADVLQSVPNVQAFLVQIAALVKNDGWLYFTVPALHQKRIHIGNLTVWSPAHLVYNLICAGYDCSGAMWYTEYETIAICLPNRRIEDMSWRTGDYREEATINEYSPGRLGHDHGSWWANKWPEETKGRVVDPPLVTVGEHRTNLPPEVQLAYGPNPALRKPPKGG
jgi:SAM-dependent methyltransferase